MNTHSFSIRAGLMLGALLLTVAPIAQRAWADPNADNASVEKLLDQASYQSYRLETDADTMIPLLSTEVAWQGRADELARIKLHVNDLGKIIAQLQSSRVDASPWQKRSIDEMVPLLREVAANTTLEIDFMREHESWPALPQYRQWANQSAATAQELADMISDTVQYGEDRAKLADLSDGLHMRSGS